uniref:Uncharacterized protein n=1 Tax=Cannabis sativa TaxID=3483 RepID=A0A803PK07_CANSA
MAELPISYQPCPTLDKINPKTTVTGYPVRKKSSSTTTDPELLTCSKWLIVLFFLCLLLSTVYVCYLLFILSSSNPEISVISSSVATVVAYNVSTNYYLVDDLKVGFQAKNLAKKDMVYKNISLFVYHRHKKFSGSVMLTPTLFEEKSGENKTIWTTLRMRLPIDDWIGSKSDNKSSTRDDDYVVVGVLDLEFRFQGWIMNKGLPYVVHTTETCNYMLEVLMIQKRVKDMAVVFDFMQKNKVHRALNTYLVVYKGLYLKGEIQQAPIAMNVM